MSGYSSKAFLEGTRWENFRIMQKCKLVLFFEVFEQEILGLHGILKNNWSYKKFDTKKQLVTWNYKILLTWNYKILLTWNSKKQLVTWNFDSKKQLVEAWAANDPNNLTLLAGSRRCTFAKNEANYF
jgi:hypothetical protein